ncbi:preprotein translocase subunit SecE [Propionicimonas sp.]|uniref:preprotein translocase subunit SecE n=1 Tax=Propionicimonas sp. TaxID=1955623 RepID=UPI0025DDDFAC|nr:preprotein translocase subunit SecE [Propionicimonas sp.]MCG2804416.1 preprotein translocase subunit SecE [Propionicimonas sp.]
MVQKKDRAAADVPDDAHLGDAELEEMGLEDLDEASLTESEKVAKAAASARPTRKNADDAGTGKGHATPKRSGDGEPEHKRTTPVQFTRESIGELKKVVWPTWDQLQQYFLVVLVFVLIMIGIVSLLDLGFGAAILKLFG